MRLSLTEQEATLREEVRSFLAAHESTYQQMPAEFDARVAFLREWQRTLHAANLVGVAWPREYGGRGATLMEQIIVEQEMARAGAPELLGSIGLSVVGPSIIEHGTPEQKAAYVDAILSADEIWCQGFSEPDAGSDLASLRTRAADCGDHFVLNGQKIWTTFAPFAKWCAVLARTDLDAPVHRGISYLIVDMDSEGVEVRPLVQTTGDAEFGEVFFQDVIVPRDNVLGELNSGWRMAMHTLAHERGPYAMTRQVMLRVFLDHVIDSARRIPRRGRPAIESENVRALLARAHVDVEVLKHHCYRSVGRLIAGGEPGPDSSVDKLVLGRAEQHVAAAALDVLGAYAVLSEGARWAAAFGEAHHFYFYGRAATVYGGTAQIQKNIVAERLLQLPRSS